MMIKVLFFAQLKERLDCGELLLELGAKLSLSQLISQLAEQDDNWKSTLEEGRLLMAVNHNMATPDTFVHDGDEVAFFPPVTGG